MICVGFALKVSADFSRGTIPAVGNCGAAALCMSVFSGALYRVRCQTRQTTPASVWDRRGHIGLERCDAIAHRSVDPLIDF